MTDRNSVLEEVLDKISDLAGEALDNGDAGKGDHWYYRIHGLEDAAHAVRALRTPVEPVLPEPRSGDTSKALREALERICDQFAAKNAEVGRQAKAKGFDTAWVYFGMAKEISTLKAELLFALSSVGRGGGGPLRQAAAHLCAFDWELLTSPASPDLNARILALRAELA